MYWKHPTTGALLIEEDGAIIVCEPLTHPIPPPITSVEPKQKKTYKKRKGTEPEDESIADFHAKRGIGEEKTKLVETALLNGISVATIASTTGVSKPTVYVIRERMKKEGTLTD